MVSRYDDLGWSFKNVNLKLDKDSRITNKGNLESSFQYSTIPLFQHV